MARTADRFRLAAYGVLIASAGPAFAQDGPGTLAVWGDVRDAESGQPIAGVSVRAVAADRAAFTDAAGRFRIEGLEPGTHTFEVRRLGYETFRFVAELTEHTPLSVELFPDPLVLDAISVVLDRFEERLRFVPYAASVWTLDDFRDHPVNDPMFFLADHSPWIDCAGGAACGTIVQGRRHTMALFIDDSPQPRGWAEVETYRLDEVHRIEFIRQCAMVRLYTNAYMDRVARGEVRMPRSFGSDCLMVRRMLRLRFPRRRRSRSSGQGGRTASKPGTSAAPPLNAAPPRRCPA